MEKAFVVDFEGNGENFPDIVELSAIEILNWTETGQEFYWLVKPHIPISRIATRIHGIRNEDVANCPHFSAIEDEVKSLLHNSILIGHNVNGDISALKRKINDFQPFKSIDTLRLARRFMPKLPSYNLHNICETLEITSHLKTSRHAPHSAAYDALLAGKLFIHLKNVSSLNLNKFLDIAFDEGTGKNLSFDF